MMSDIGAAELEEERSSARRIGRPTIEGNTCAGKSATPAQHQLVVLQERGGEQRTRTGVTAFHKLQRNHQPALLRQRCATHSRSVVNHERRVVLHFATNENKDKQRMQFW